MDPGIPFIIIFGLIILFLLFIKRDKQHETFSFPMSIIRDVKKPSRGTLKSAGIDFYVPNDFIKVSKITGCIAFFPDRAVLSEGASINIPSGIRIKVPQGFVLVAFNKSGVALNKGLQVGACVIDEDYQGEIHLHVINIGSKAISIFPGEKLVQFLLLPVCLANPYFIPNKQLHTTKTERGANGFGSTNANSAVS